MTLSNLTQADLMGRLEYSPDTGAFTHKHKSPRGRVGDIAGSKTIDGYWSLRVCGKTYLAHRLAWLYVHGEWPKHDIDHISGNKSDNRIANLRDVTRSVNCGNQRRARVDNKIGLLGVCKVDDLYIAQIGVPGRIIKLGKFNTPDEAHSAYLSAKRSMHAGCTI
jgi:hypothetical protein